MLRCYYVRYTTPDFSCRADVAISRDFVRGPVGKAGNVVQYALRVILLLPAFTRRTFHVAAVDYFTI